MTPQVAAALTAPVVAGTAVGAFLLVVLAYTAVDPLIAVVHEGGHMGVGVVTGLRVKQFRIKDVGSAVTGFERLPWGPGRILMTIAGYTAPPLVGLGGAALLAAGNVQPALWTALVLLVLAWAKAEKEWTTFVVLLLAAAVGYVAVYGAPLQQAAFAAGLVFVLLIGGVRSAVEQSTAEGSDAAHLAHDTLLPRQLWKAAFVVVAIVCLWNGFLLLAR